MDRSFYFYFLHCFGMGDRKRNSNLVGSNPFDGTSLHGSIITVCGSSSREKIQRGTGTGRVGLTILPGKAPSTDEQPTSATPRTITTFIGVAAGITLHREQ
eukprot:scaffold3082_cov287-Chaetoceros_neogracile.AAC.8